ncbi:hypothetical protein V5O48_006001 [Marasmius crinis-equi]|uniref:Enamelin n=1 Tax=Marasmius crinis-equi TaxID=585013 RepID=A0ABR3FKW7_9AGAR
MSGFAASFFENAKEVSIGGHSQWNKVEGHQTNHNNNNTTNVKDSYNSTTTNNYDSFNNVYNTKHQRFSQTDKRKANNTAYVYSDGQYNAPGPAGAFQFARQPQQAESDRPSPARSAPTLNISEYPYNPTQSADGFMPRGARKPWSTYQSDSEEDSDSDWEREPQYANGNRHRRSKSAQQAYAEQYEPRGDWQDNDPNRHAPGPYRNHPGPSHHPSYPPYGGYPPPQGYNPYPPPSHHPSPYYPPGPYPQHYSPYPPNPQYPYSNSQYPPPDPYLSPHYQQPPPGHPGDQSSADQPLASPVPSRSEQYPAPGPRKASPHLNPFHPNYKRDQNASAPPSTTAASSPPPGSDFDTMMQVDAN